MKNKDLSIIIVCAMVIGFTIGMRVGQWDTIKHQYLESQNEQGYTIVFDGQLYEYDWE